MYPLYLSVFECGCPRESKVTWDEAASSLMLKVIGKNSLLNYQLQALPESGKLSIRIRDSAEASVYAVYFTKADYTVATHSRKSKALTSDSYQLCHFQVTPPPF